MRSSKIERFKRWNRTFQRHINALLALVWLWLAILALFQAQWYIAVLAGAAGYANAEAYVLRRRMAAIARECRCGPGRCNGRLGERCRLSGFIVE